LERTQTSRSTVKRETVVLPIFLLLRIARGRVPPGRPLAGTDPVTGPITASHGFRFRRDGERRHLLVGECPLPHSPSRRRQ